MFEYVFILKFVTIFLIVPTLCLESPEPEVLLQPRNYNPHPYHEGGRVPTAIQSLRRRAPVHTGVQARTGPVLFPPNPDDVERLQSQQHVQRLQNNGVDGGHPYASVARKQKIKLAGRFLVNDQENNINPRVYSGLANYAAKVLKKPATTAQHNGFPDPSLAGHKKNYAFSYTVRDRSTGDDFSHSQSQNAAATNGEYRVKLPDGRVQIVSYTADSNGYKADVKYADDDQQEQVHHQPVQHHYQQPQQQQQQFLQEVQQVERNHQQDDGRGPIYVPDYEYYEEPREHHRQQVTQIEVPIYDTPYSNNHNHKYQPEYVTIYPDKVHSQYLVSDKVHIYPGSIGSVRDHDQQKVVRIGGNIQSQQKLGQTHASLNLADKYTSIGDSLRSLSYHHADENLIGQVGGSVSTVSPPHYSQVYYSTPKYSLVHSSSYPDIKPTPAYYKRR